MGGVRLVTMDGELLEASGAMVGGSIAKSTLKFGAASQGRLDEVAAEYRAVSASLEGLRAEIRDVRAGTRVLEDQLMEANKGNAEVQGRIGRLESQIKVLEAEKARQEEAQRNNKALLTQIEAMEKESLDDLATCEAELNAMRNRKAELRDKVSEIAPAEIRDALDASRKSVYVLTLEINDLVKHNSELSSERSGYENSKSLMIRDTATYEERIKSNLEKIEGSNAAIARKTIDKNALDLIKAGMDDKIADLNERKSKLLVDKTAAEKDRDKLLGDKDAKEYLISTIDASVSTLTSEIDLLVAETEGIPFEIETPLPSENELKRTIRTCEDDLVKLGNVNLRAIEDHNAAKARYDGLEKESDELNGRIKDLNELMETLGEQKKVLFMRTYDGIDVNFRSIYSELSGGGEAFMKLENEDDPFSGGLLINAKPKNGKLLRLEALSGGEKSLTALAFIFAIQEFQPSPFYVLDEVDMFLDSVNAEMVAKRVRESSSKAQFIQVSLRKVTLALAQHLIGVARLPSGLSKVIMQPDMEEVSRYEEEAAKAKAADEATKGE